MIGPVRWVVTLTGRREDTERLAAEFSSLSPVRDRPDELLLQLDNPEGDTTGHDARHAAKAGIDAHVRRINGFGRLRWGRMFEGVSISRLNTIDSDGRTGLHLFPPPFDVYLAPEEFADMVETMGYPRRGSPAGIEVINALTGDAVTTLAATNPDIALVLRLVDLMLQGDDEIDWGAGYSALEVIEQDLHDREWDGRALGWWTSAERERFKATANSVEVLGARARHGRRSGLTEARLTSKDASWFVRRAAALWMTRLLEEGEEATELGRSEPTL